MRWSKRIPVSLLSWTAAALLLAPQAAAAPGDGEESQEGAAAVVYVETAEAAAETAETAAETAEAAVETAEAPVETADNADSVRDIPADNPAADHTDSSAADSPEPVSVDDTAPEGENPEEETAELEGLFGWKSRPALSVSLEGWTAGGTPNSPVVTGNVEDAPVVFLYRDQAGNPVPDIAAAPAGSYTLTVFLEESEDYTAASARTAFDISPAYTVTWVNADGAVLEQDRAVEPGTVPQYDGPEPERAADAACSYVFQGWDPALTEDAAVYEDTTFTAVFTAVTNQYAVDFLDDDGTVLRHAVYDYGTRAADIVRPATPVKGMTADTAFTFLRWTPEITDVTGDAAYTAVYQRSPAQIYHPSTGAKPYYSVLLDCGPGGTVRAMPAEARPGTPVLLSPRPDSGYALDVLIVRGLGRTETLGLSITGDSRTFVMPSFDVSVTASFRALAADTPSDTADPADTPSGTADPADTPSGTADPADTPSDTTDPADTPSGTADPADTLPGNTSPGQNVPTQTDVFSDTGDPSDIVRYSLVKTGFSDVSPSAYYASAVRWAAQGNILPGLSDTAFAPDSPCTRGQMVLALWRASGSPRPSHRYGNPFADVDVNSPYYDAVLWALEQGVTRGTTDTTFSPDRPVTRAQAVTLLYRLQGSRGDRTNPFSDAAAGMYFYDAALWACAAGITRGTSASTFSPHVPCTRAQAAAFLFRLFVG